MEVNTNECPVCNGHGRVISDDLMVISECRECLGSGILSDSELAELLESTKNKIMHRTNR